MGVDSQGSRPGAGVPPVVAVSMGDPFGIGPEVIVRALSDADLRRRAKWVIHGWSGAMARAADAVGVEPYWWRVARGSGGEAHAAAWDVMVIDDEPADAVWPAQAGATAAGGGASFRFVEDAIARCLRDGSDPLRASAIVTGPISKEAWSLAGHGKFAGHTELLAARFGARRSRMMFVAPTMRVMLATAHIPLSEVPGTLTIGRVHETIELGDLACRGLGVEKARIAVCGVNPHAGEAGLLGSEEGRVIEPAIAVAREQGIDARGPYPGDTVFREAARGGFDLVVAMYHDQGLIAVKTLAFDEAVNVTIGLPTIRTSPDHGTAFGIAGKGVADAGSMRSAMALAVEMASRDASRLWCASAARRG